MSKFNIIYNFLKLHLNEKKSQKSICKLQSQKLRKLLRYAFDHSAYYRELFEKNGITAKNLETIQLSQIPTTNKSKFMANFDSLVTVRDITQDKLRHFDENSAVSRESMNGFHVIHSSGSTGTPRYFLYDRKAWEMMIAGIIRGALWRMSLREIFNLLIRKPRIAYIAATDGRYGGAMAVGDGIDGLNAKQIYLDIKQPIDEWIEQISIFCPNIIIGYPSAVKVLAELVEHKKVRVNAFRVVTCVEPLSTPLRKYLEKTFSSEVVNFYGASESLALGAEGSSDNGMVLFDDMNIIETLNGKMYLTCLYNFVQPLIRYEISDRLILKSGEPFTMAVGLIGRNEDIMWFERENGQLDFIHPLSVEGFCIDGLLDYRFIQNDRRSFTLEFEKTDNSDENAIRLRLDRYLSDILSEKKLENISYELLKVTNISVDCHSGKKKLIVGFRERTAV